MGRGGRHLCSGFLPGTWTQPERLVRTRRSFDWRWAKPPVPSDLPRICTCSRRLDATTQVNVRCGWNSRLTRWPWRPAGRPRGAGPGAAPEARPRPSPGDRTEHVLGLALYRDGRFAEAETLLRTSPRPTRLGLPDPGLAGPVHGRATARPTRRSPTLAGAGRALGRGQVAQPAGRSRSSHPRRLALEGRILLHLLLREACALISANQPMLPENVFCAFHLTAAPIFCNSCRIPVQKAPSRSPLPRVRGALYRDSEEIHHAELP